MADKVKLSALYLASEATFALDPSANGSGYTFVKAKDMSFEPGIDVVEREGLNNDLVRLPHVMGAKGGKVSFKLELKGSGTAAANNVAAIAAEADLVLQALFGSVTRQTGDTVAVGGTTTTVVVSTGARFTKYGLIWIDCGATYGIVGRFVTNIAGNTLTIDRALPGALSAATLTGNTVYGASVYKKVNTGHTSLAFVGARGSFQYTFLGCKVDDAKITGAQARGTAMLEVTCSVSDWSKTTKASLPATSLSGVTAVKAPVVKGSPYAVGSVEELVHSFDFNFGHKFAFKDATGALGTNQPDSANAGLELVDAMPGGTVKSYYADQHMTDFAAGTEQSIAIAVADSPTAARIPAGWGFYGIKCQYKQPTLGDHNGLVDQTLPFMVNDNSTDPEYVLCVS